MNHPTADDPEASRRTGMGLMMLGVAGLALGALKMLGVPWPLPLPQPLWIGLSLVALIAGAGFTWRGEHPRTAWRPTRPGRRFQSLVLYTRRDCPLCDEAVSVLSRYADYLPATIEVDVDSDPNLRQRFDTCVPVVELDRRIRFRGHVSETLLQRLIEGAPPVH